MVWQQPQRLDVTPVEQHSTRQPRWKEVVGDGPAEKVSKQAEMGGYRSSGDSRQTDLLHNISSSSRREGTGILDWRLLKRPDGCDYQFRDVYLGGKSGLGGKKQTSLPVSEAAGPPASGVRPLRCSSCFRRWLRSVFSRRSWSMCASSSSTRCTASICLICAAP